MSNLKILVWQNREGTGEPDVEVKVPTNLAKWIPRLMRFVPRRTMEQTWGQDVNFDEMFADIERLLKEVSESGQQELMNVKTKDAYVKVLFEK
jgi:hypothetical protein